MPHNHSSSHPPKKRRERNIRIRDVRKPEPDLQRIAETIFDMAMHAASNNQSTDKYFAAKERHTQIKEAFDKAGFQLPEGQALPGCTCIHCKNRDAE